MTDPEEWLPIPGYDGDYLLSADGRVYSVRTRKCLSVNRHGRVVLFKDRVARARSVRRLVHSLYERPEKPVVSPPSFSFLVGVGCDVAGRS